MYKIYKFSELSKKAKNKINEGDFEFQHESDSQDFTILNIDKEV